MVSHGEETLAVAEHEALESALADEVESLG